MSVLGHLSPSPAIDADGGFLRAAVQVAKTDRQLERRVCGEAVVGIETSDGGSSPIAVIRRLPTDRFHHGGSCCFQHPISHHGLDQKGDRARKLAAVPHSGFIVRRHDDRWNSQACTGKMVQQFQSRHFTHVQIDDQTARYPDLQGIQELTR
jgi:hypothetical protein